MAPAPDGFEIVRADVASGKTSVVSLVRRLADGALFAWKVPIDDTADTRWAMEEQIERSRAWTRLGVATGHADWAADGRTLLQPWVDGETLRALLESSAFPAGAPDARHAALVELCRRLAAGRTFVSGLNAANLVFDGTSWRIVDSGNVRLHPTPSEAWERQRADLLRKWTRGALVRRRDDVLAFLAAADAALALPPPPFSVRRVWRRLRGR